MSETKAILYELGCFHPSYTFFAQTQEVAALTIMLLGESFPAFAPECEENNVPSLYGGNGLFGERWYVEKFSRNPMDGFLACYEAVVEALGTFVPSTYAERLEYEVRLQMAENADQRSIVAKLWLRDHPDLDGIAARALLCHQALTAKIRRAANNGRAISEALADERRRFPE